MLTQQIPPTPVQDDFFSRDDGRWYTVSSGMPAGDLHHRVVVVANDPDAAMLKLEIELSQMGWLEDSYSWIWSGAGSQTFENYEEAQDFANYLMGICDEH